MNKLLKYNHHISNIICEIILKYYQGLAVRITMFKILYISDIHISVLHPLFIVEYNLVVTTSTHHCQNYHHFNTLSNLQISLYSPVFVN